MSEYESESFICSSPYIEVFGILRKIYYEHCVKSVRIRSFSGPYSVQMRENTEQENYEYGHFSRCGSILRKIVRLLTVTHFYKELSKRDV